MITSIFRPLCRGEVAAAARNIVIRAHLPLFMLRAGLCLVLVFCVAAQEIQSQGPVGPLYRAHSAQLYPVRSNHCEGHRQPCGPAACGFIPRCAGLHHHGVSIMSGCSPLCIFINRPCAAVHYPQDMLYGLTPPYAC